MQKTQAGSRCYFTPSCRRCGAYGDTRQAALASSLEAPERKVGPAVPEAKFYAGVYPGGEARRR